MANGILNDDELSGVSGGTETYAEDIYSYYSTCEDWTCAICRKRCIERCHICENGSISKAVCNLCLNYDHASGSCLLGKSGG